MVYVVVVATLVALIVPAWWHYNHGPPRTTPAFRPPPKRAAVTHTRPLASTRPIVVVAPKPAPRPVVKPVRLVVVAARGNCWLRVRAGSPTGRILFEGTVSLGGRRAFTGRRIVVFAGAPQNLDVTLGGSKRTLGGQALWLATAKGLAPLKL